MTERFIIKHCNGDDYDNMSVMEWEVTSADGFLWNDLTDMFVRALIQQSFVISKQQFIEHIEQMECVFNYPDDANTDMDKDMEVVNES